MAKRKKKGGALTPPPKMKAPPKLPKSQWSKKKGKAYAFAG